jgi:type IV pilus assembly protein PilA
MLNGISRKRGFTLVELLITVALLGVLATIALAEFAAYRQKGYNSSATSDLKNAKTLLEAYFASNHYYP